MRHRVLIIEDDAAIAQRIEDLMLEVGHTVVGRASSADAALKLAGAHKADIAIIDVTLDDGDTGLEIAEELSRRHGLRVVFLTGHRDFLVRAMTLQPEPLGFVVKPFSDDELLATLRS